jgi:uncharacterized protein
MALVKLLLAVVVAYVGVAALLYFAQTRVLFPASMVPPAGPLPAGAERLHIRAQSGERLSGVHIPARPGGPPITLLGFGGNAWNAETMAVYLHGLFPEADVVAFHYRGYAPSEGSPAASAIVADAPLVFDLARERLGDRPTVAIGFSIGSGVAAALAARRPLDGLVLVTPFDSLGAVAAGHYPWLPVRLLLRHRLDAADALRGTDVPVAVIAAAEDTLIGAERTEALRPALRDLRFDRTIAGAGHNDLYDRPEFRTALREAVGRLLAVAADDAPGP